MKRILIDMCTRCFADPPTPQTVMPNEHK